MGAESPRDYNYFEGTQTDTTVVTDGKTRGFPDIAGYRRT